MACQGQSFEQKTVDQHRERKKETLLKTAHETAAKYKLKILL